jgi:hypothetical protein
MKLPRELRLDIERIAEEAGATVAYEMPNSHVRVVLTYQGRSRFVVTSGTSANWYRHDNVLGDVRRALRDLGYVKPKAATLPKHKQWRNSPQQSTERRVPPSGPRYRPRYRSEVNAMTVSLRALRARMY